MQDGNSVDVSSEHRGGSEPTLAPMDSPTEKKKLIIIVKDQKEGIVEFSINLNTPFGKI